MTTLDQNAPLSADERAALITLHEYDELLFGGFVCTVCTPNWENGDDPDDNVAWPCPPLREAGVSDHEAVALIKARRAEIERRAAVQRVRELLAETERLSSERDKAIETVRHTDSAMVAVGTVMENAVRTATDLGAGAGMDVIIGYLSDCDMLPPDALTRSESQPSEVDRLKALLAAVETLPAFEHGCDDGQTYAFVRRSDLLAVLRSEAVDR